MLRYIQAGIIKWVTPQTIAQQGSYSGKFKGGLTDLVAIVQSYFTAGLITVTGANVDAATTTSVGVVELATLAETVRGTDTERAVTPSSLAPYTVAIAAAGWAAGGVGRSIKSITAATHLRGLLPKAYVYGTDGTTYTLIASTSSITIANGNIVVDIATIDIPANGIIVITQ